MCLISTCFAINHDEKSHRDTLIIIISIGASLGLLLLLFGIIFEIKFRLSNCISRIEFLKRILKCNKQRSNYEKNEFFGIFFKDEQIENKISFEEQSKKATNIINSNLNNVQYENDKF